MKFGIFYEHQLPRPWKENDELKLYQDALDQVELADNLGIDYVWEVEHHFLEEYAHSSAPEVFLAACSQRTKNIRLGHGIKLMPPNYNHPARIAEEIATLDLVSNGRVEFGTGESSSLAELGGFKIPVEEKRNQWLEAVEQTCNMMAMEPYPGYEGKYFSMPCRNVVPKPTQRPHPPLWVACSNRETIKLAAKLGIGALTFAFVDPDEAKLWVDDYYRILKEECIPIGHSINPNIAMVTSFGCHQDHDEAVKRMKEGFQFFSYGLGHHYIFGINKPGRTNIWEEFQKNKIKTQGRSTIEQKVGPDTEAPGIGTPKELSAYLKKFEKTGVDQVTFIQQGGRNKHEHICEALELFASDVMPEFKEKEIQREKEKMEELEPYLKQAMKRKKWMAELKDDEIPNVEALGRQIIEESKIKEAANKKKKTAV
ncbi:MAG TPA: LLM class flavin-dependent oxidoreductase [Gammaproteobacteria bacterium]|jgi:alkanesulfonate monooxygenase SsuD/methylene tetrahydromethanopterin reductase-like flavin-dependent oxidoreductase (luciferase family)|nr:LLM class flavin-dependent oxidoreductase [Gammaproteobacteria bacterium]HIM21648.1 LLM class flavin-dependent oxidoreductase [Gammaproteobacteria bacterium]